MSKLNIKSGTSSLSITEPYAFRTLELNPPIQSINKSSFLNDLGRRLTVNSHSRIGIVVSDKTRLCGYDIYIPWICEYIEAIGVDPLNITFYIAYGTHPVQSDDESLAAYGESFLKYKFVHHNCDDYDIMTTLGETSYGTKAQVRKDIFSNDKLILFGAISHHYFAGYGGGRKLIFPGLASRDSIYQNHKLFIDFEAGGLHPGCQSGELDINPVALDLEEIDNLLPEKIIISGILNDKGEVAILNINENYSDFRATCQIYKDSYHVEKEEKYDLIIASAGGYPKDINFIQSHKALHNAASFVVDGGKLILIAECADGIGNKAFINIFSGSKVDIINDLKINYSGNGGTALATLNKSSRIEVSMFTSLSDEYCKRMGIHKVNLQQINNIIDNEIGNIGLIKNASIIF
ncbi:MAG: nickel-dependent lactate racemase [Bacteroidales bacterium]|nr:nickel-dependent lactate racemase [Bacteroidales bacterium]